MPEHRVKKISEILEQDTSEKSSKILEGKPITALEIVVYLILSLLTFIFSILFEFKFRKFWNLKETTSKIIWELSIMMCFFFSVNTLISLFLKQQDPTGKNQDFLSFILKKNSTMVRITLTLGAFLFFITFTAWFKNITSPMPMIPVATTGDSSATTTVNNEILKDTAPSSNESEKKKKEKKIFENYLETKYESIIAAILLLFISLLSKRIFLQFINYRIHFKYYKERIRNNTKIVKYLHSLNEVTGLEPEKDVEEFNSKIFDSMKSDPSSESLVISDFQKHFGRPDGKKIFALFDIDENDSVSKEEFFKRYQSLLKEKELLDNALNANDTSIKKLDIICSIILFPLTFVFILFCLDAYSKFEGAFKLISAILLSVSFAFSSVVSSVFQSIIFVFFVRPFDIGDVIEYENKMFTVADLGILYSTLIYDSTYETIPNDKIRDKGIKNLRKSSHVTVNYQYQTSETDFERIGALKEKIDNFLQENTVRYHEKCRIYNFCQLTNSEVKFSIQIIISCRYQELQTLEDRKDKFALFILNSTKEMNLSLKKHK